MNTAVALVALDSAGHPVPGVVALLKSPTVLGGILADITNLDGYMLFDQVPVPFSGVLHMAGGCQFYEQAVTVAGNNVTLRVGGVASNPQDLVLPACVPFRQPRDLESLAAIRGAMWTARLNLPWGPRPGQDDNCITIDYFESFTPEDEDRIIAAYGPAGRGYTHAPMGPMVDAGYHGQLPAEDWRGNPDPYLDAAAKLERAGVHVIHFLRPDRGCAGLEWTVDDLNRELGPIFRSAKAQSLMAMVCLGWEPGPKYFYDNSWWVEMLAWQAETFPRALRLLHMVSDCDAPVGGADNGKPFGVMWGNVTPYLHGWLVQNGGYAEGGQPYATADFDREFAMQFDETNPKSLVRRFRDGFDGWPTGSAWGPDQPLRVYSGEFAAYGNYWLNFPENESRRLGKLAIDSGAAGSFDGC
jgi:hypothetical protein